MVITNNEKPLETCYPQLLGVSQPITDNLDLQKPRQTPKQGRIKHWANEASAYGPNFSGVGLVQMGCTHTFSAVLFKLVSATVS